MTLIVSLLTLSGLSQAASLSMLLSNNASMATSASDQMPCHQANQMEEGSPVCQDCIDCHFYMVASAQIINTNTKTTFLSQRGLAFLLETPSNTHSKDYPPAVRPPII